MISSRLLEEADILRYVWCDEVANPPESVHKNYCHIKVVESSKYRWLPWTKKTTRRPRHIDYGRV